MSVSQIAPECVCLRLRLHLARPATADFRFQFSEQKHITRKRAHLLELLFDRIRFQRKKIRQTDLILSSSSTTVGAAQRGRLASPFTVRHVPPGVHHGPSSKFTRSFTVVLRMG